MDASEALVNELQAEVEEQAALKEQDQSEAEKSMKWKMLQQQFKAHYREKGKAKTIVRRTKDEKDVHTMLENFEEKVNSLNPPDLTQKELKTAEELQMKLANAKPEEIPAIQDQMKKMADEAGMFFISSDGLKIGEIGNEFNEMVDEAKFRSAQDTIKEQLNQWIDKKMSDAEMMLVIQVGFCHKIWNSSANFDFYFFPFYRNECLGVKSILPGSFQDKQSRRQRTCSRHLKTTMIARTWRR
jgi:hypothetical protein